MNRLPALAITAALAAAACAGCGSSGSTSGTNANSTTPPDAATSTADIKTLYAKFFSSPPAQAATLLEDGSSLTKTIGIADKIKGTAQESAKVDTVTLTTPTTATLTYDLSTNGAVVLKGADGKAVYEGGQWLVSKDTFCGLVGLTYSKPLPGC
jgi:hypothetical protein